ncbi:MAG TPA: DUF1579 family protein [Candidatus Acidoferrales bacterium]
MKIAILLILVAAVLFPAASTAQRPEPWHDELVDHLAGDWKMTGDVMGRAAHHDVKAEWILNHQFLRIEENTSATAPDTESKYDAIWFLGYDPTSERYVMHLMDQFGGRFSETLGYGVRDGNAIRFVFEYPDGPFHTTLRWDAEKDSWEWLMEQKDKNGKWSPFADLKMSRVVKP